MLQQYLRCFMSEQSKKGFHFLWWAEYCYNSSYHSSAGMTPFKAVFVRDPSSIVDYIPTMAQSELVDFVLCDRKDILDLLKLNLTKAQKSMKKTANMKREHV